MYKRTRKGIAWILSFAIVMSFLCSIAQALDDPEVLSGEVIKEGDYVVFGSYKHKTATGYEDEATPISWQVAAKKNGYARLVSEYVLDEHTMDESKPNASYSWLNSPYEAWLNNEFFDAAFSEAEKVAMLDYDELYYTLDQNGENYSGYYYRTGPGIKIGIVDYYIDGYFNYASRPLGLGNSQASHKNMRATLKDGTLADYWTGTTSGTYYGHHIITATETDAVLGTSNGDAVHGVRPMIKLQLNKFSVVGSGTKEDPYVVSETFDVPDPVAWANALPVATISDKVITLAFSSPVKWTGVGFGIANFSVKRSDNVPVSVVSANLINGVLVLQLDKSAPAGVKVTLNYNKPKYGYIMKDEAASSEYVDSFTNLMVVTVVPGEAEQEVYSDRFTLSAPVDVMTGTDAVLDPGVPAWGGHQSRVVRTQNGVYMLVMVDVRSGSTGDPSLHPNSVRKFQIMKVDASGSTVMAERVIAGQATSLVADKSGNLYVICHDKTDAGQLGYGRPTIYKLAVGSDTLEQYFYDVDDAYSGGATNYEAVSVDKDGNILVLVPYVNHTYGESRFIWTKFDVTTNQWSPAQQIKLDRCFLYPYILPQADGTLNIVAEIGIPYSAIEVEAPDGYTFLVNEMRMWNIPSWGSSEGVTQDWAYSIPFTEEEGYSVVQNASFGDSYTDSMGYTHTIMCATRFLGMNTAPSAMVYSVFDQNNQLISETTPFIGNFSCRFVEDSRGNLYLLKMESGSNLLELYAINASHTAILTDSPVLSRKMYTSAGEPIIQTYSGISVASPRGGSAIEDYVDIIIPSMPSQSGQPTTWQYIRLTLGDEEIQVIPPVDPAELKYPVVVEETANGSVTVQPRNAREGDRVTVAVMPETGYEVTGIYVTDKAGNSIFTFDEGNGTYSFVMPGSTAYVHVAFGQVVEEIPFADVSRGAWYYDSVSYAFRNGLMIGVTDTSFQPDAPMTRAMIWTILARLSGENVDGGSPWYAKAQDWAIRNQVSDGSNPNGAVTREEFVTMLYRYYKSPDVGINERALLDSFADSKDVSEWAENAASWAVGNELLVGMDGQLNPKGSATRAQIAEILMRFCEKICR